MRSRGLRQGTSTIILILLIVVVLLLTGGGLLVWKKLGGVEQRALAALPRTDGQQAVATETLSLGEFLVNLRSADSTLRYLQTEVRIVVLAPEGAGEEESDAGGHGEASGAAEETVELPPSSQRYARDITIEVLSSQSFEHLRDEADRAKLKTTLREKLDAALEDYEVQDVLFTAFVMQ